MEVVDAKLQAPSPLLKLEEWLGCTWKSSPKFFPVQSIAAFIQLEISMFKFGSVSTCPKWLAVALAVFSFTASTAEAETLTDLALAKPFAIKINSNPEQLITISGIVIRDAKSDVRPDGKIYLASIVMNGLFKANTYNYIPLEDIQKLEYFVINQGGWDNYALTTQKSGAKSKEKLVSLRWCGGNADPVTNINECYQIRNFIDTTGRKAPLYGLSSGSYNITNIFNGKAEVEIETGRLAAAKVADTVQKKNEERRELEARREADAKRLHQLATALPGTQDFCTSYSLLASGAPIRPTTTFKCGVMELVTVSELRDANWDVQLNGRTPTKGQYEVGDSVDITITKHRQ